MAACGAPPARLWFAGDVQVEAEPDQALAGLAALRGAGLVNLEGPVLAARPAGEERLFNHPGVPAALARFGVRAVSLQNNHLDDGGSTGRVATQAAVAAAGLAGIERTAVLTVDGQPVSVVVALAGPPEALAAAVRAAAPPVVVSLHVVAPPVYLPSPATRAQVEAALAAGAAVVVVHGSHALAPVERRGRQVVAWGLGNVAFACACTQEDEALALEVTLAPDGVVDATVVPIRAGLHGAPMKLEPEPAGVFDLLEGMGSTPLIRRGARATF